MAAPDWPTIKQDKNPVGPGYQGGGRRIWNLPRIGPGDMVMSPEDQAVQMRDAYDQLMAQGGSGFAPGAFTAALNGKQSELERLGLDAEDGPISARMQAALDAASSPGAGAFERLVARLHRGEITAEQFRRLAEAYYADAVDQGMMEEGELETLIMDELQIRIDAGVEDGEETPDAAATAEEERLARLLLDAEAKEKADQEAAKAAVLKAKPQDPRDETERQAFKEARPFSVFEKYLESQPGYQRLQAGTPHLVDRLKRRFGDLETRWRAFTPWTRAPGQLPATEDEPGVDEQTLTFQDWLTKRGMGPGDPLKMSAGLRDIGNIMRMTELERDPAQQMLAEQFFAGAQEGEGDLDFAHQAILQPMLSRVQVPYRQAVLRAANRYRKQFELQNLERGKYDPGEYLAHMRSKGMF